MREVEHTEGKSCKAGKGILWTLVLTFVTSHRFPWAMVAMSGSTNMLHLHLTEHRHMVMDVDV